MAGSLRICLQALPLLALLMAAEHSFARCSDRSVYSGMVADARGTAFHPFRSTLDLLIAAFDDDIDQAIRNIEYVSENHPYRDLEAAEVEEKSQAVLKALRICKTEMQGGTEATGTPANQESGPDGPVTAPRVPEDLLARRVMPSEQRVAALPPSLRQQLESDPRFAVPPPRRAVTIEYAEGDEGAAAKSSPNHGAVSKVIAWSPSGTGFLVVKHIHKSPDGMSDDKTTSLHALGGLVSLLFPMESDDSSPDISAHATRIDLEGPLFPLREGNRFALSVTYHSNTGKAKTAYESHEKYACSVGRESPAARLRPEIPGKAVPLDCRIKASGWYSREFDAIYYFFPELGFFVADSYLGASAGIGDRTTIRRVFIE